MNQNEDLKSLPIPLLANEVEIENAVNLLIVKGYLLAAPDVGVISVSGLLARFYKEKMSNLQVPQTTAIQSIKEERISLRDFKEKADIPWRVTTKKGTPQEFTYNTGQISEKAEKYFNTQVVGKVNMDRLIQVTKAYYKDETVARPTLTNYFLNGVWEDVLKNYLPKEQKEVHNPSFTGDRRI